MTEAGARRVRYEALAEMAREAGGGVRRPAHSRTERALKFRKVLQELQISENLKDQALELEVSFKFENWEYVDQVLYTYAKKKGFS